MTPSEQAQRRRSRGRSFLQEGRVQRNTSGVSDVFLGDLKLELPRTLMFHSRTRGVHAVPSHTEFTQHLRSRTNSESFDLFLGPRRDVSN